MKKENIFKSKIFLKLFCIPLITWLLLSLLLLIPDKNDKDPITWSDLAVFDIIVIIIWFLISTIIYYIYKKHKGIMLKKSKENKNIISQTTPNKKGQENINDSSQIIFLSIMSIITFLIGCFLAKDSIGLALKPKITILLASFFPFILFLIITIIAYKFKQKNKSVHVIKTISIIITCLLLVYYSFAFLFVALQYAIIPVVNTKYYNKYVSGPKLEKVFPKKIPQNAKDVQFYYIPGLLQGGTNYSLYYVDDKMTANEFEKKYKNKAIWIGHQKEYNEKAGLLGSAFSYTPANFKNENDYIIYLIDGNCDNSGYCNHGEFLFTAYNDKTNEIIFRSEQW